MNRHHFSECGIKVSLSVRKHSTTGSLSDERVTAHVEIINSPPSNTMSDTFYGEVKLYNNEDLLIVSYFKRKKTLPQTEVVAPSSTTFSSFCGVYKSQE